MMWHARAPQEASKHNVVSQFPDQSSIDVLQTIRTKRNLIKLLTNSSDRTPSGVVMNTLSLKMPIASQVINNQSQPKSKIINQVVVVVQSQSCSRRKQCWRFQNMHE